MKIPSFLYIVKYQTTIMHMIMKDKNYRQS